MAANKEFVYSVKVTVKGDDGQPVEKTIQKTTQSLETFEEHIGQLKKQLQGAKFGSDEFKNLQKEIKNVEGAFEKAKLKSQGFFEGMSAIPGPIGQIGQGVQGLGKAFKVLLANPIAAFFAAIVAAATLVYKAFTSTKEGAEKMDRVFASVGAVLDVLRDRFLKFVDAVMNFDLGGIIDAFSGMGDEMANEAKQAANLVGQLQKLDDAERDLAKSRADTNLQIAEAKLKINDENLSMQDRLNALEEVRQAEIKLAAQEEELARKRWEAIKAQNALSDSSKEALEQENQAYIAMRNAQLASQMKQKELFDQQKALRDRQRAEAKAAAAEREAQLKALADFEQKINLELITDSEEKAAKQLELNRDAQLKEIDDLKTTAEKKAELKLKVEQDYENKLAAQRKTAADAAAKIQEDEDKKKKEAAEKLLAEEKDREKRRLDAAIQLINVTNEQELENLRLLLEKKMNMELANADLTNEEKALIEKTYQAQLQAANDTLIQMDKDKEAAKVQAAMDTLGALSEILGKETKAGKAAAIGQALVNTFLGVTQTLGAKSVLPEPFGTIAKIVQSAAISAAGLKAVQEIRGVETNVPKYAGGGIMGSGTSRSDSNIAMLSNGESVINAQSTAMFAPLLSAINQIGGGRRFNNDTLESPSPSISNTQSPVIKTYVVSKDITTQQQLDRQQKSRSIF